MLDTWLLFRMLCMQHLSPCRRQKALLCLVQHAPLELQTRTVFAAYRYARS